MKYFRLYLLPLFFVTTGILTNLFGNCNLHSQKQAEKRIYCYPEHISLGPDGMLVYIKGVSKPIPVDTISFDINGLYVKPIDQAYCPFDSHGGKCSLCGGCFWAWCPMCCNCLG